MSEGTAFDRESGRKSFGADDDTMPLQSRDRQSLRDFQSRTLGLIHDNPIVAGFAALAIGALIGALIPETDREHELMGGARDRLAGRARDLAANAGRAATGRLTKTDIGHNVGLGSNEPEL